MAGPPNKTTAGLEPLPQVGLVQTQPPNSTGERREVLRRSCPVYIEWAKCVFGGCSGIICRRPDVDSTCIAALAIPREGEAGD